MHLSLKTTKSALYISPPLFALSHGQALTVQANNVQFGLILSMREGLPRVRAMKSFLKANFAEGKKTQLKRFSEQTKL